ncbi:MAG: MobA/MobL family protein [Lachnospiraceae bacterium]|nr:MobA/MobL family protein [Lachnospiraceae bacterium]
MAIYHCSIKLIGRSGGRSAVASAAYRSGEKLLNEETGITHDFTKKGGVIMSEILLPTNAPERYLDRQTLWNEVQKVEKRADAQLAREVEVALPSELTRTQQIECVRSYINDNFTSKGMIADWALHDKGDGNPHAHIMLSVRAIDENEKWTSKQKSVFANVRDDKGRPIYDPSLPSYNPKDKENTSKYRIPVLDENGNQKTRERKGKGTEYLWERISIPANDWNEHSKAEEWRKSWAEHCNQYLAPDKQIDHRSYKRQGLDIEPTIHEGVTARQIEKRGDISDRCEINKSIKVRNLLRQKLRQTFEELTTFIIEKASEIYGRYTELKRHTADPSKAGRDVKDVGGTAGRDRQNGTTDFRIDAGAFTDRGTSGRIHELKRGLYKRKPAIERADYIIARTESEIADTDRHIEELSRQIKDKENDNDERLRKLKERRRAYKNVGGNAGRNGYDEKQTYGKGQDHSGLERTASDISAFLSSIEIKEQDSRTGRRDSELERLHREDEQRRLDREREREAERRKQQNRKRSRGSR